MAYSVHLLPAARRQRRKLPPEIRPRIDETLISLADPRPPGVTKLQGHKDRWRVRVGDYRIIYRIDDDAQIVTILVIVHRREAYR